MHQNEPLYSPGIKIDGFKLIKHIGSGGTAEVWEVEDANLNRWAFKIFSPTRGMDEHAIRLFKLEFQKTEKLVHSNILRARKYGEYQNRPYIIFDLCDTSVMKMLHDMIHASRILSLKKRAIFREEELAKIICQVADALKYLHENGIVHQDIKPDNILVKTGFNENHTYMISDFGVSTDIKMTILRDSDILRDSNKGLTPDYAAPELYQGAVIPATDIFALGISLFELSTGRPPISNTSMTTAIALLNGGSIPDLPEEYSQRFNAIIKKCLQLHPEERPTAAELVEWSTFFIQEQYWPDPIPVQTPSLPSEAIDWLRYLKPVSITFILISILCGIWFFIWPMFFNTEAKLNNSLSSFDIETAASIYQDLNSDQKAKYHSLSYLPNIISSRIETVNGQRYLIVKHKSNEKLGLIDPKGKLLIPLEYDKILRFYDPSVVTVQLGNVCSQYDLRTGVSIENGVCKIYKSRNEFIKEFSK